MIILIENEQIVHLGPIFWNQIMLQTYIHDEFGIDVNLPMKNDNETPFFVNDTIKIIPCELVYPDTHNNKIEQYSGPNWTVVNNVATGAYINVYQPVDAIANTLKEQVTNNRWLLETNGTTAIIQGQTVNLTTKRGDRDMFLQALQLMAPTDTKVWKLDGIWLTLTYTDLQQIVMAVVTHVQQSFDWEQQKHIEIDTAILPTDFINITTDNVATLNNMTPLTRA